MLRIPVALRHHLPSLMAWLLLGFSATAGEFRGIWVDAFGPGFFNAKQVKKLAEDCRQHNFNAVFVEMRRRGDAFYHPQPPNTDPRTSIITTNFDALSEIIKECHTGSPRIQVHCWVVSHFVWAWDKPPGQPSHIFNLHPEYLTQDFIGQKRLAKGWYLDPGHPEANKTVLNMARDIVSRYDIDGFHWDYFRYPVQDSGYNPTAIARYNAEFGLTGAPAPDDHTFSDWRRRQVTDFLRYANAELWAIKPGLIISAAVFANIHDSRDFRFADWPQWSLEGIVDFCVPMNFTPEAAIFDERAKQAAKSADPERLWMGVGAYMNSPEKTLQQLKTSKKFPGTVLYSYRSPAPKGFKSQSAFGIVQANVQPTWTEAPRLPWKRTTGTIKGRVLDPGTKTPLYDIEVRLKGAITRTILTDVNGAFAFFNLPSGLYDLQPSLGHNELSRQIRVVAGQCENVIFE